MNAYGMPEYRGFVAAMRGDPKDRVAPAACADWLEEHGKAEHAGFIRGCVRMAILRDVLDECLKMDLHYTDPQRAEPSRELDGIVHRLRPLINRHCHEWTGGAVRRFDNPTVYDWPLGFLRVGSVNGLESGSDRATNRKHMRRLASLLARQPVAVVHVFLPSHTFAPHEFIMGQIAKRFPGIEFRCKEQCPGRVFKVTEGVTA